MRLFLFTIALCAAAQQKPNFSGNWLLNLDASDYSPPDAVKPDKITIAIQQRATISSTNGSATATGGNALSM